MLTKINDSLWLDLTRVEAVHSGKVYLMGGQSLIVDAPVAELVQRACRQAQALAMVTAAMPAAVAHHLGRGSVDVLAMADKALGEFYNE